MFQSLHILVHTHSFSFFLWMGAILMGMMCEHKVCFLLGLSPELRGTLLSSESGVVMKKTSFLHVRCEWMHFSPAPPCQWHTLAQFALGYNEITDFSCGVTRWLLRGHSFIASVNRNRLCLWNFFFPEQCMRLGWGDQEDGRPQYSHRTSSILNNSSLWQTHTIEATFRATWVVYPIPDYVLFYLFWIWGSNIGT